MLNVRLSLIRTDGGTQARATLHPEAVADYAEAIRRRARLPPPVVFHDGQDYWLADGFHRVAAYAQVGVAGAPCDVRTGSRRDAVLFAVGANAEHGLRRSNADKRRAVEILLHDVEWSKWSDREIARRAGVSQQFVSKLRGDSGAPVSDYGSQIPGPHRPEGERSDAGDDDAAGGAGAEASSDNGSQMDASKRGTRMVNRNGRTYAMRTRSIRRQTRSDPPHDGRPLADVNEVIELLEKTIARWGVLRNDWKDRDGFDSGSADALSALFHETVARLSELRDECVHAEGRVDEN